MVTGKSTILDVARIAGVSTATVSRALAHPDRVQQATRDRVMSAVRKTGYRVNPVARNLRTQRTNVILVLAPNLANTFFSRILSAITDIAASHGFGVLIADSAPLGDHDVDVMNLSGDGRADGIILLDGALDPLRVTSTDLPLVMACEWIEGSTLPVIAIDNVQGASLAVEHLSALGHHRIAHIAGPVGNVLSTARHDGWRRAMQELDHRIEQNDYFAGDFTLGSGVSAARQWLAQPADQRATAVFCASDECAMGFIGHVTRQGLRVPDDVSVVGFDDIDLSEHFLPSLTTIHQPRRRMGARAAETVIGLIRHENTAGADAAPLPVELVVRGSTARR